MKKFLMITLALTAGILLSANITFAENVQEQTKAEETWETVTVMSQAAAEKTAESVREGSKKAGKAIAEGSKKAADKAAPHIKSGAEKVKTATVRGANKVSNSTAKGMKKMGKKMQSSAEKTIEKTVNDWVGKALLPDDITVMNVRF